MVGDKLFQKKKQDIICFVLRLWETIKKAKKKKKKKKKKNKRKGRQENKMHKTKPKNKL